MLINKNIHGYSKKKKHITGRGFVDTMSSVFKNIYSYVPKPVLGAIGSLATAGLSTGVPALLRHIASRNVAKNEPASKAIEKAILKDPKYRELLHDIILRGQTSQAEPPQVMPVTNIIGSGARKRRGAGIKKF